MIRFNLAIRNAVVESVKTSVGDSASWLRIYTGSQPATADTAPSGTLLCEISLGLGFNAAATGFIDLVGSCDGTAVATGTAGWARWSDNAGSYRVDGSVGTAGTDFIISPAVITSGQIVTATSVRLTQPAQ